MVKETLIQNDQSESGSTDCSRVLNPICLKLIEYLLRECAWVRIDQGLPPVGVLCFLETERGIVIGSREDMNEGWHWSEIDGSPWYNGSKWDCDVEGEDMEVLNWMPFPHPRNR